MPAARVRSWIRAVFHRSRLESGMEEEMRFHIEQYAEDLVRTGVPAEEARRRARAEFGSLPARQDECREAVGLRLLGELSADARFAGGCCGRRRDHGCDPVDRPRRWREHRDFHLMEAALWKNVPVRERAPAPLVLSAGPKIEISNTWEAGFNSGRRHEHRVFPSGVSGARTRQHRVREPVCIQVRRTHHGPGRWTA